ncbi:hypothetical protein F5Y05DRAFT_411896 [Hypoxylon sp. FL0543]|nr:hypothetical protein F5Y05DRAFT_411896 [Hypoxylon sp. FL0543]
MAAPTLNGTQVSESDQKYFATLMKYLPMPAAINLDWDAFSKEMGFKSVSIAKVRFNQIRRKYDASKATSNNAQDPLKSTKDGKIAKAKRGKGSGKGRAKKGGDGLDHGGDDEDKIKEDGVDVVKEVVKKEEEDDEKGHDSSDVLVIS